MIITKYCDGAYRNMGNKRRALLFSICWQVSWPVSFVCSAAFLCANCF